MAVTSDWDEVPGFDSDDDSIMIQALDDEIEPCEKEIKGKDLKDFIFSE